MEQPSQGQQGSAEPRHHRLGTLPPALWGAQSSLPRGMWDEGSTRDKTSFGGGAHAVKDPKSEGT